MRPSTGGIGQRLLCCVPFCSVPVESSLEYSSSVCATFCDIVLCYDVICHTSLVHSFLCCDMIWCFILYICIVVDSMRVCPITLYSMLCYAVGSALLFSFVPFYSRRFSSKIFQDMVSRSALLRYVGVDPTRHNLIILYAMLGYLVQCHSIPNDSVLICSVLHYAMVRHIIICNDRISGCPILILYSSPVLC